MNLSLVDFVWLSVFALSFAYRLWDFGLHIHFEGTFPSLASPVSLLHCFLPCPAVSDCLHPVPYAPTPELNIMSVPWVPIQYWALHPYRRNANLVTKSLKRLAQVLASPSPREHTFISHKSK